MWSHTEGAKCLSLSLYLCPDGYKAQFLRYLDENFMEGVFQYYLEVLFLGDFSKKVIFGVFRAILNFLVSLKNGGDQDFLYFNSIDEKKLSGEVCAYLDLSKSHFWPF